jgi:hypothetical protein
VEVGAWFQDGSTPSDRGTLGIAVDGKSIASFIDDNLDWTFFSTMFVATGSDEVAFDLGSGSGAAFFDDAVVTEAGAADVPEPSGLAAIALGLVGLARRRKRSARLRRPAAAFGYRRLEEAALQRATLVAADQEDTRFDPGLSR